jgi:hypothetical protein
MHHIVGHWYFLFAALKQRQLSIRALAMELRHIMTALLVNPQRGRQLDVPSLLINVWRAISGAALAMQKLLSGPRHIDSVKPNSYKPLLNNSGSANASAEWLRAAATNYAHGSEL